MKIAKYTAIAAMFFSAVAGTASAATPVRPGQSRTVAATSGVTSGVVRASSVRASKHVADDNSIFGLPLIFIALGAVAITATIVAVASSGSSN